MISLLFRNSAIILYARTISVAKQITTMHRLHKFSLYFLINLVVFDR